MITKIYLACFPSGMRSGDVIGYALAETGEGLASHLSSNVSFSKHDMGLTSNWKHDHYAKCFPEGYEIVWIDNAEDDERWQKSMELNKQKEEVTKANLAKEGVKVEITFSN